MSLALEESQLIQDYIFLMHARLSAFPDVNECLVKNGGCDSKRKCINLPGSSKCGDCPAGWLNEGASGCKGLHCTLVCFLYFRCELHMHRRAPVMTFSRFTHAHAHRRIRRERVSEKQWRLRQQAQMHQHGGEQNMWKLPSWMD